MKAKNSRTGFLMYLLSNKSFQIHKLEREFLLMGYGTEVQWH
jgi:hypothetical protein